MKIKIHRHDYEVGLKNIKPLFYTKYKPTSNYKIAYKYVWLFWYIIILFHKTK